MRTPRLVVVVGLCLVALPWAARAQTPVTPADTGTRLHTFSPPDGVTALPYRNLFVGYDAGSFKLAVVSEPAHDGQYLIGVGPGTMRHCVTCSWSVAIGNDAMRNCETCAGFNVGGADSVIAATGGSDVTTWGIDALRDVAGSPIGITALGARAMKTNTAGDYSTAVGFKAYGEGAGTGQRNTVVGALALHGGTTSARNVAVGAYALFSATTAQTTVAVGDSAGRDLTTGNNNTLVGTGAGNTLTTGGYNLLFGSTTGQNLTTANHALIVGTNIAADSATEDGQLNIGNVIKGYTSYGATPGIRATFLPGTAASPSVKVGDAGWYQGAAGRMMLATGSALRMTFEAGYLSIWDNGATIRLGASNDVSVRRVAGPGLTIDNGSGGALAEIRLNGPVVTNSLRATGLTAPTGEVYYVCVTDTGTLTSQAAPCRP